MAAPSQSSFALLPRTDTTSAQNCGCNQVAPCDLGLSAAARLRDDGRARQLSAGSGLYYGGTPTTGAAGECGVSTGGGFAGERAMAARRRGEALLLTPVHERAGYRVPTQAKFGVFNSVLKVYTRRGAAALGSAAPSAVPSAAPSASPSDAPTAAPTVAVPCTLVSESLHQVLRASTGAAAPRDDM
jgi:hypothetical protein